MEAKQSDIELAQALGELQVKLGYVFCESAYLQEAMTHRSYMNEHPELMGYNNQRLEYLGDAVLDLLVAELTYEQQPALDEGQMSKLRAAVVCEESLAGCASDLGLAACLQLGQGEVRDGGCEKPSILADALEALFAAIYLDAGFARCREVVRELLEPYWQKALSGRLSHDYKSALLEYAQSLEGRPKVSFEIISASGPVHQQEYCARATLLGQSAEGCGLTKKQAEQNASRSLLGMI